MIIWNQASQPHMNVPEPEEYGWKETEIGFELQPDSETNINKQKTIFVDAKIAIAKQIAAAARKTKPFAL